VRCVSQLVQFEYRYADDSFLHKGCELQSCYEQVYDDFMSEMDSTANASKVPWMVAPGNHEVECHDPVGYSAVLFVLVS